MSTMEKLWVVAFGFATFAFAIAFAIGFDAHLNNRYETPTGVQVADADLPGQVIVSWAYATNTPYHLIAYTTEPELQATTADERHWTEVVTYEESIDGTLRGHRVSNLEPNTKYAFNVGRLPTRTSKPIWAYWVYHTTPDPLAYPNELRTPPPQPPRDQDGRTPHPLQPPEFIRPSTDTQRQYPTPTSVH